MTAVDLDRLADLVLTHLGAMANCQRDPVPCRYRHGWVRVGMHEATLEERSALRKDRGITIPPGWTDVQVADDPDADLQVLGKDAKGRPQYVYSAAHADRQAAAKFERIRSLHGKLPEIDRRLAVDAPTNDDAAALMLIRRVGLRPGSDRDTGAERKAHGATNLLAEHVQIDGDTVRLTFTGKKGVDLDLQVEDPELVKILEPRLSGKGPGERLLNTNERRVSNYLHRIPGGDGVKVKDLRTYRATDMARELAANMPTPGNRREHQAAVMQVARQVSTVLGNTPAMARDAYIDPAVFAPWRAATDSAEQVE